MEELFTRYDPTTPPEEREGSPVCVVDHPDAGGPCGGPAVGEGWGCLPFCEKHWREAEVAAREELAETVQHEVQILANAERQRFDSNAALVRALKAAEGAGPSWGLGDYYEAYRAAEAEAFPAEALGARTDPETLGFDYRRDYEGDGPAEWWSDVALLLVRFLRQASEQGVPNLMRDLERLRERATAQRVPAERDRERRWRSLPKAERLAIMQAHYEERGSDV